MTHWNEICIGYWDKQHVGNWDKQCAGNWDKQCAGNWDKQCIGNWDKQHIGYWNVTPRGPGGGAPGKPRVHAGGRRSEAEPCRRHGFLACVPHVATVLAYQDLPGHVTYTADYENAPWVRVTGTGRFGKFQHYRLVLREVANPIQSFRNTKELVQVFCDALKGKKLSFAFCLPS